MLPEGLDEHVLVRVICGVVRAAHPRLPDDPHEGAPVEEVFVRSITRRSGWHIHFGYVRNAYPRSRYDKSEQAEGKLQLDRHGKVASVQLGPLRTEMDRARARSK